MDNSTLASVPVHDADLQPVSPKGGAYDHIQSIGLADAKPRPTQSVPYLLLFHTVFQSTVQNEQLLVVSHLHRTTLWTFQTLKAAPESFCGLVRDPYQQPSPWG